MCRTINELDDLKKQENPEKSGHSHVVPRKGISILWILIRCNYCMSKLCQSQKKSKIYLHAFRFSVCQCKCNYLLNYSSNKVSLECTPCHQLSHKKSSPPGHSSNQFFGHIERLANMDDNTTCSVRSHCSVSPSAAALTKTLLLSSNCTEDLKADERPQSGNVQRVAFF